MRASCCVMVLTPTRFGLSPKVLVTTAGNHAEGLMPGWE